VLSRSRAIRGRRKGARVVELYYLARFTFHSVVVYVVEKYFSSYTIFPPRSSRTPFPLCARERIMRPRCGSRGAARSGSERSGAKREKKMLSKKCGNKVARCAHPRSRDPECQGRTLTPRCPSPPSCTYLPSFLSPGCISTVQLPDFFNYYFYLFLSLSFFGPLPYPSSQDHR